MVVGSWNAESGIGNRMNNIKVEVEGNYRKYRMIYVVRKAA
jgi:hypothetical protein